MKREGSRVVKYPYKVTPIKTELITGSRASRSLTGKQIPPSQFNHGQSLNTEKMPSLPPITGCNQKRGAREVNRITLVGTISELLLAAGILVIADAVYVEVSTQVAVVPCRQIGCTFYYSVTFLADNFYLGLALLIGSAIGFGFVLAMNRRANIPQGETSN